MNCPPPFASKPSYSTKVFPDWAIKAWNLKTLKTMIRVLVVYIACHALLFTQATLNTLGQAAFFSVMVSVMLPPNMAVSLFMLAATTLLMGMLIGWAWGCAAMAAGLRARNMILFQSQYLKAQTALQSNPDATFRGIVFEGQFLDARVSTVYGVFFFLGTFFFGYIRASKPKLGLLAIFGTIVIDVMCSYGPLFPTAQYKLVTIFLLPTSCYVAIALASIVLIFPESMSHVWIGGAIETFFQPSISLLALQESILASSIPLDTAVLAAKVEKSKAIRKGVVTGTQAILGLSGLVDLEVSVGKLGPGDLQTISSRIKALVPKTLQLVSFATFVADMYELDAQQEALFGASPKSSSAATFPPTTAGRSETPSRFVTLRKQIKDREERLGHDLSVLLPILRDSSLSLRSACSDAVKDISSWLELLNESRWKLGKKGVDQAGEQVAKERVEKLRTALKKFRETERHRLVRGPFAKFFDLEQGEKGGLKAEYRDKANTDDVLAARSLFVCFVFTTTLESYAESLLDFFTYTVQLRQRRQQSRLWAPSGLGKIWRKIKSHSGPGTDALGSSLAQAQRRVDQDLIDEIDDEESDADTAAETFNRDPDVSATIKNNKRSQLSNFFGWFKSVEGLFALRHAVVSMGLWIIAIHPTTAAFNYRNRYAVPSNLWRLWALIMAQTGLGVYAGDMISQFVFRFGGTAIGLVLGMVGWYIGAGRGTGNPYGLTAISCVLAAPILYARISLPMEKLMAWLMAGITMSLIIGYSWIDTHIPVTASAGVGVDVAWRRALLVIIGFAAAFIVTCFPRITSARVTVRKTAANLTAKIGALFVAEIEAFLIEESRIKPINAAQKKEDDLKKEKRLKIIDARWLKIAEQLQGIVPVCDNAKLEPHIRGPWPRDKYEKLFALQWKVLIAISIISNAFRELNVKWTTILVRKTPFLNANLLSDVFTTISLLSSSLKNSHPLPAALPALRERLVCHQRQAEAHMNPSACESKLDSPEMDKLESESIRGSSIGLKSITMEVFTDPQLPLHSTAVVALSSIITALDDLTEVTRSLVGEETNLQGFDDWRSRNVRYEEEGISRAEETTQ